MTGIKVERLDDLPQHNKMITGIHRHPAIPSIVMTTSRDGCLKMTDLENELCNFKLQKDKIISSAMTRKQAILTSYRSIYSYDYNINSVQPFKVHFVTGKKMKLFQMEEYLAMVDERNIHIVDSDKKQLIQTIKTTCPISDFRFFNEFEFLYCANDLMYHYDLRSSTCIKTFKETNFKTTKIAITGNSKQGYLATGSESGVVYLYKWENEIHTLIKEFGNLKTSINGLEFYKDYLLMHSNQKKDSLRIVDIPNLQVLSNWPTHATPLGYVECSSFLEDNLILGNSKGKVSMYSVNK
eukprot:NODE_91_length_21557_cov_0.766660.p11 type:complete len:296 gc:universal NODE_91_length_21557_cov_0.766660:20806-19919(-)